MLSTHIYNQALNLATQNCKSAGYHGNEQEALRQLNIFRKLMEYGHYDKTEKETRPAY